MGRFKMFWFLLSFFIFSAYSLCEEQRVRIGGEVMVRGIWWKNMEQEEEKRVEDWFDSTVHLYFSADLSDRVGLFLSFINERDWRSDASSSVDLDLAYFVLTGTEQFPFSITLGRQELVYGEAFLIGANPEAPVSVHYPYGARVGFDALKLNITREPWQIDLFQAKILEGYSRGEDFDLYGVNIHLSREVEWDFACFCKYQNPEDRGVNQTYALSIRGEKKVCPGFSWKGEVVREWGRVARNALGEEYPEKEVPRDAWGGYVGVTYSFDNPFQPFFSLTQVYESGDRNVRNRKGKVESFDPLCEDETFGIIADGGISDYLDTSSNKKIWIFSAGFNPNKKISLELNCYFYKLVEPEYNDQRKKTGNNVGQEYDLVISCDYTEGVSFCVWGAIFYPGEYMRDMYGSNYHRKVREAGFSLSVRF